MKFLSTSVFLFHNSLLDFHKKLISFVRLVIVNWTRFLMIIYWPNPSMVIYFGSIYLCRTITHPRQYRHLRIYGCSLSLQHHQYLYWRLYACHVFAKLSFSLACIFVQYWFMYWRTLYLIFYSNNVSVCYFCVFIFDKFFQLRHIVHSNQTGVATQGCPLPLQRFSSNRLECCRRCYTQTYSI